MFRVQVPGWDKAILDGGGLAGEGGGWMKRDSKNMIESLNGVLDGGCSDGQIWRGTTGGRRVAGRRMPGWRTARLATRKKERLVASRKACMEGWSGWRGLLDSWGWMDGGLAGSAGCE